MPTDGAGREAEATEEGGASPNQGHGAVKDGARREFLHRRGGEEAEQALPSASRSEEVSHVSPRSTSASSPSSVRFTKQLSPSPRWPSLGALNPKSRLQIANARWPYIALVRAPPGDDVTRGLHEQHGVPSGRAGPPRVATLLMRLSFGCEPSQVQPGQDGISIREEVLGRRGEQLHLLANSAWKRSKGDKR